MRKQSCTMILSVVFLGLVGGLPAAEESDRIEPCMKHPYYWQYDGKPVLLLGGSKDDNIFLMPDLESHLKEISEAGGNYVRNTMSSRKDQGFEIYPFKRLKSGKYDLDQWNAEYWQRFENLLRWSSEREIIVQIEIWDRFDYSRDNWPPHPYNPKNNVNYTYEESRFAPEYPNHPGTNEQPFFFTTPKQQNNRTVLKYQQRFVEKLLDHSLDDPNVLYCMDNETSGQEAWAVYWAEFVRQRANREGVPVNLTEMWDAWDLRADQHRRTLDHPNRYDFVDVSQNNHQRGETHWKNFLWVRDYIEDQPRPLNNVKIYGADGGKHGGDDRDAVEKMWRLIFAGAASARFHRPTSGIGISELAKTQLRSARLFLDEFDVFHARPDANHRMLSEREENEAYLTRIEGKQYAVYFTDGGEVGLRLPAGDHSWSLRWLDIDASRWSRKQDLATKKTATLKTPEKGQWVALIELAP